MLSHPFSRSTAIFRNAFGYRPIVRFATRSPFPCKVCQMRLSQFWGSDQDWGELPSGFSNSDLALHVAPRPLPIPLSLITSAVLYAGAEDNR